MTAHSSADSQGMGGKGRVAQWWDALGKPVPEAARRAAYDLLVAEGCNPGEASLVVPTVAREIEHDEPERAQATLRHWLPAHGSETLVLRTMAVLCTSGTP